MSDTTSHKDLPIPEEYIPDDLKTVAEEDIAETVQESPKKSILNDIEQVTEDIAELMSDAVKVEHDVEKVAEDSAAPKGTVLDDVEQVAKDVAKLASDAMTVEHDAEKVWADMKHLASDLGLWSRVKNYVCSFW